MVRCENVDWDWKVIAEKLTANNDLSDNDNDDITLF